MPKRAPKSPAKEFNAESKLPYEITLPVGDWSDDGHGKCEEFTFRCSHPVEEIRAAYIKSVKEFGISFDRDHKAKILVAAEYGDHGLPEQAQETLAKIGYDMKKIAEPEWLQPRELADIILWMAGKNLKDFEYAEKKKTYLNGHWNKQLNVQFGYGLFGD